MWRDCQSHPASFCRHAGYLFKSYWLADPGCLGSDPSRGSRGVSACHRIQLQETWKQQKRNGAKKKSRLLSIVPELTWVLLLLLTRLPSNPRRLSRHSSERCSVAFAVSHVQFSSLKSEMQQSRKFKIKLCRKLL